MPIQKERVAVKVVVLFLSNTGRRKKLSPFSIPLACKIVQQSLPVVLSVVSVVLPVVMPFVALALELTLVLLATDSVILLFV